MANIRAMVVTAILENDNKLLILKRSEKVKSYKHKWSGISGYFEKKEDLLSRALIEIYEETQIKKENITLRKILEKIEIEIENSKKIIVQPFLFSSKTNLISLNWENDEYKWIKEEEVKSYDTVPRLIEMLYDCFVIVKHS
jgi:8-oxo-dGTP pyrophosphatase MutT (NUDIX family)